MSAKRPPSSAGDGGRVFCENVVDDTEYAAHLTQIGRTFDEDVRVSVHESGHAVVRRALDYKIGGVTVDGGMTYSGMLWGPARSSKFSEESPDASDVTAALKPFMPRIGEPRAPAADTFLHVHDSCTEFVAGKVAERLILDGEPSGAADDYRQAREIASLLCSSSDAIERFLAFCEQQAFDLLNPRVTLVVALSTVLRIRRTMMGDEIDRVIATALAHEELAIERKRRTQWKHAVAAAQAFDADWMPMPFSPASFL